MNRIDRVRVAAVEGLGHSTFLVSLTSVDPCGTIFRRFLVGDSHTDGIHAFCDKAVPAQSSPKNAETRNELLDHARDNLKLAADSLDGYEHYSKSR